MHWANYVQNSAWQPRNFGDVVLHVRAADISGVAEDGALSTIYDRSGFGNGGTCTNSPTYKAAVLGSRTRPVIRFNGSNQSAAFNGIAPLMSGADKACTVLLAGKLRSVATAVFLCGWSRSSSANPFYILAQESSKWETDRRDDAASRTTNARQASDTNAHVFGLSFTGTADTLFVDGTAFGSDPMADDKGIMTIDRFTVGAVSLGGTPAGFSQLDLGELIVWKNVLPAANLAFVTTHLRDFYGI